MGQDKSCWEDMEERKGPRTKHGGTLGIQRSRRGGRSGKVDREQPRIGGNQEWVSQRPRKEFLEGGLTIIQCFKAWEVETESPAAFSNRRSGGFQ